MKATLSGSFDGETFAVEVSAKTYDRFEETRRSLGMTRGELLSEIELVSLEVDMICGTEPSPVTEDDVKAYLSSLELDEKRRVPAGRSV